MSLEDLTTDQLLAKAKEMEPSHALVQSLAKDPEARSFFQRLIKKRNPTVAIPEIDTEDRILKALGEEREKREKLEAEVRDGEVRRRVEAERTRVQSKYKLTDEDMKGVEALMVKSDSNPDPIPLYDAAARVFKASRTPAEPTASSLSPPIYTMPEKEVWGKGIGNPAMLNRIGMEEAFKAFNEIRGGKVAQ